MIGGMRKNQRANIIAINQGCKYHFRFIFAKISHSFPHDTSSFPPRTSEPMAQRASHLRRHDGCFQRGSSLRLDGDRRARRFAGRFPHHSFVRAFLCLFNFSDILLSSHEAGAHFLLHVAGFSSRQVWSAHFVAHAGRRPRHPVEFHCGRASSCSFAHLL